ncbi:glycosyltransferase involved in cell wall biosynthesis [Paenibacillus forsythiae]|uniref:Glycosyltransferase involved in cell wall biosynthesis n=1 Tax=Paenibacillus forsythiae TaxID=365616 RepID=A0ABU3HC14_9BACL|nr:glycosyltransferase family 2 protein [Paenibacillus forsythiae]MDT3428365.1 glycosyltransferase involved in cell wall biosynthesis [Paenibacillus forsythiae]
MANLSVLMPVYNASCFLEHAVESILQQSYTDFELIVINDGSTDNSLEILERYSDPRIKLIHNGTNSGIVSSLNCGLNAASGAYIARMDADDYSLPDRFKAQIQFMDLHPEIGVCGTQYRIMGSPPHGDGGLSTALPCDPDIVACSLLINCCLAHPSVMLRRRVLDRLHSPPYDPDYQHAEDYHLWARLSAITRIANLEQCYLYYRQHDLQLSRTRRLEQLRQADRIRLDLLNGMGLVPTSEEWELHLNLCYSRRSGDGSEREWIRKILFRNLSARRYDQLALMDVLNSVWRG